MELGFGRCFKTVLMVIALSGHLLPAITTARTLNLKVQKLLPVFKPVLGQLNVLRECRRQLTFLGSMGLGHFITRIMKESPLTPLPLPPLEDPPRWNFLTLPLQFSAPYFQWMKDYAQKPHLFYKDFHHVPTSWNHLRDLDNSIDDLHWLRRSRRKRQALKLVKPSPIHVAKAVKKTMKFLHSALMQHKGTIKWLTRWCR